MTAFNTATINKIKFIAECAHEDCALTTLKNAKEQVTNRCKVFAGYESQWQGIDRAEVIECFTQAMDCTRKADFSRRIELLLETMRDMEIENERAAERAKIAAATPAQEVAAVTADEFARDVVRTANRLFGLWVTRDQIDVVLADGNDYTAEQVARVIYNEANAAARRQQYADQLTTAQQEYDAAQLATEVALNAAVDASTDGTEDTPEFLEYERTEQVATAKATALLQACGRYSVEMARFANKPIADIEALKNLFIPAMCNQIENYHPGQRNKLISLAMQPVTATSSTQAH